MFKNEAVFTLKFSLLFFFLAALRGLQDLSFLTRDGTQALSSESRVLTTEPPGNSLFFVCLFLFNVN